MNRWSTIQQLTNKFCGYLTQIENMNQSGTTEHDKIAKAKAMYHKIHDVSFPFEHCWNLLKDQPKWMRHAPKEKPKRRSFMATSSNLTPESPSIAVGDDALDDNNGDFERPIGRKAEKAKRKKIERTSEDAVVFMKKKTEILEETRVQGQEFIHLEREKLRLDQLDKEHRRIIDEEKLNMERKKFQLQQQDRDDRILEREEDREERILEREEKIMLIDTSGMSLVQQKYWNQRQLEISQKR